MVFEAGGAVKSRKEKKGRDSDQVLSRKKNYFPVDLESSCLLFILKTSHSFFVLFLVSIFSNYTSFITKY